MAVPCQCRRRKEAGEGSEGERAEGPGRALICCSGSVRCVLLLLSAVPADPPIEIPGPLDEGIRIQHN